MGELEEEVLLGTLVVELVVGGLVEEVLVLDEEVAPTGAIVARAVSFQ